MFFTKRKKTKIATRNVAEVVLLNQDTIVLGTFRFKGVQKGAFFVKDTATIEISATVEGDVTALNCHINGLVKGNVFCANNLWLGSLAVIEGAILARKGVIETGCIINGAVVLAPDIEIPTLDVKIIAAEKMIVERYTIESRTVLSEGTSIPQEKISIREVKTLVKNQRNIDIQNPESSPAQPVDISNNWW